MRFAPLDAAYRPDIAWSNSAGNVAGSLRWVAETPHWIEAEGIGGALILRGRRFVLEVAPRYRRAFSLCVSRSRAADRVYRVNLIGRLWLLAVRVQRLFEPKVPF